MIAGNEKQVKNISIVVFLVGIIIAIICGAKVTSGTEVLLPFFCGIGLASFGLIFWQITHRHLIKKDLELKTLSGNNPFDYIVNSLHASKELLKKMNEDEIDKDEICAIIDTIKEKHIDPFVDVRASILDMLGYGAGSELLINVAHGERLINRVWSCAADDYVHEAKKVMPEVIGAFEEVLASIKDRT